AASLVAVPSYNESFGLVAVEAQATGTPVVAAAVGGLVTVVADGVSGLLVDGHDPVAWADALRQIVCDPLRAATLADGAIAQADRFSWDRTAESTIAVYERARAAFHAPVP
ncbi:MAG: glycosyltransferase, partial [Nocardioides sp.]